MDTPNFQKQSGEDRLGASGAPLPGDSAENKQVPVIFREGVYNVEFPTPPAEHSTPNSWYPSSWTFGSDEDDLDVIGGAYLWFI